LLTLVKSSSFRGTNNYWNEFSEFMEKFDKRYSGIEEIEHRFDIFRKNLENIINHNRLNLNYTLGVNQFSDLSADEFKSIYANGKLGTSLYGCKSFSYSESDKLPESVDWRERGVVNPVRNQGQCGSCWAFATTANAESAWAIKTGQLLDLSEEYLVDCASGIGYFNAGCNGGQPDSAFKYMINNGQCYESSYPYEAGKTKTAGKCNAKCEHANVSYSQCFDVPKGNQLALAHAVAIQPVVIALEADTAYFQSYSGGILDSPSCKTTPDHAVEIVGYGTENGIDYWIVRNSWGNTWGENGYFRIKKTSSEDDIGICGLATEPSFIQV